MIHEGEGRLLVHQILAGEIYPAKVEVVVLAVLQEVGVLLPCLHELIQHGDGPVARGLDVQDAEDALGRIVKHGDAGGIAAGGHGAPGLPFAGVVQIGDGHQRARDALAVGILHPEAEGVLVHHEDPGAGVVVRAQDLNLLFFIRLEAHLGAHEEVPALQVGLEAAVFHEVVGALQNRGSRLVLHRLEVQRPIHVIEKSGPGLVGEHGVHLVGGLGVDLAVDIRETGNVLSGELAGVGGVFQHGAVRRGEIRGLRRRNAGDHDAHEHQYRQKKAGRSLHFLHFLHSQILSFFVRFSNTVS